MMMYEYIKFFNKNFFFCLLFLSIINQHIFVSISWHIDLMHFFTFKIKNANADAIIFSISWISLILVGNILPITGVFLAKLCQLFISPAELWSVWCEYLIKHHLKHSLSLMFWILVKSFFGCLILLVIWYNCYHLRFCAFKY